MSNYLVELDKDGKQVGSPLFINYESECDTGKKPNGNVVHLVQAASDSEAVTKAAADTAKPPVYPHRSKAAR